MAKACKFRWQDWKKSNKHHISDTDDSLLMSINSIHTVHTVHTINLLPLLPLPPLPLDSKGPQSLQVDTPQCTLLRSLKVDLWDSAPGDATALEGPDGLEPPAGAQAPLAALTKAHGPEVVALARRVVEEVLGDHARHGVVAPVHRAGAAVAVTVEACHGLC